MSPFHCTTGMLLLGIFLQEASKDLRAHHILCCMQDQESCREFILEKTRFLQLEMNSGQFIQPPVHCKKPFCGILSEWPFSLCLNTSRTGNSQPIEALTSTVE